MEKTLLAFPPPPHTGPSFPDYWIISTPGSSQMIILPQTHHPSKCLWGNLVSSTDSGPPVKWASLASPDPPADSCQSAPTWLPWSLFQLAMTVDKKSCRWSGWGELMGRTELETCDIILISWDSVKSEMIFEIKARLDEEIVNLTRTFDEVKMKDLLKWK